MKSIYLETGIICLLYCFISFVAADIIKKDAFQAPSNPADCIIDITKKDTFQASSNKGPLIYKYSSNNLAHFRYPYKDDSYCIYNPDLNDQDLRFYLSCPNHYIKFEPAILTTTSSSTFLTFYNDLSDTDYFKIHKYGRLFPIDHEIGTHVECSDTPVFTMRNETSYYDAVGSYSVGFRINVIDFLQTWKFNTYLKNKEFVPYATATVLSIIEKRPVDYTSYEYQKGLVYQKKQIDFSEIYSKEYQIKKFKEVYEDDTLVNKYFSDNVLVKAQLIFQDDLFYIHQQRSTFYYENTYPMWNSVNEGNWKLIGQIIRQTADETDSDLLIRGAAFNSKKVPIRLGATKTSPDWIRVPTIFSKLVYDPKSPSAWLRQGLLFNVANDPFLTLKDLEKLVLEDLKLCTKLIDYSDMYPQFLDSKKGLTVCCSYLDIKQFPLENLQ